MLKKGDAVCVRTKDSIGYQWVNAIVERLNAKKTHAHVFTEPGSVALLLPVGELTRVKTVWSDTRNLVKGEND